MRPLSANGVIEIHSLCSRTLHPICRRPFPSDRHRRIQVLSTSGLCVVIIANPTEQEEVGREFSDGLTTPDCGSTRGRLIVRQRVLNMPPSRASNHARGWSCLLAPSTLRLRWRREARDRRSSAVLSCVDCYGSNSCPKSSTCGKHRQHLVYQPRRLSSFFFAIVHPMHTI